LLVEGLKLLVERERQRPGKPGILGLFAVRSVSWDVKLTRKEASEAISSKNGRSLTEGPRGRRAFPNAGERSRNKWKRDRRTSTGSATPLNKKPLGAANVPGSA